LAASIKSALGIDATLVEGSNGIFDVSVDGDLVFSKYEHGRFPEADDLIAELRERR